MKNKNFLKIKILIFWMNLPFGSKWGNIWLPTPPIAVESKHGGRFRPFLESRLGGAGSIGTGEFLKWSRTVGVALGGTVDCGRPWIGFWTADVSELDETTSIEEWTKNLKSLCGNFSRLQIFGSKIPDFNGLFRLDSFEEMLDWWDWRLFGIGGGVFFRE